MKISRTLTGLILAGALLLASCAAKQGEAPKETAAAPVSGQETAAYPDVKTGVAGVNKYGNITLSVTPDEMSAQGYEPADIIRVEIGGAALTMPVGTAYSDVDSGEPVCRFKYDETDGDQVVLAVNAGNMAETLGVAEIRRTEEEPGYECLWAEGYGPEVSVTLSMVEKQGYAEAYALHQLLASRTDERADYADLSDADYANFRAVETAGMGAGALYRSSSPVDPDLNRNKEADAAIAAHGIRTILNMTDSEEAMRAYPGYAETAYAACDVLALDMEMDFFSDTFREKLAEGFRYLASHEGPYLIHCKEGKDRTGFAIGILACLMGASAEEVTADYMLTYRNFYGVAPEDPQYEKIAAGNIRTSLARAFGLAQLDGDGAALSQRAADYLRGIGLTDAEIAALRANLAKNYN